MAWESVKIDKNDFSITMGPIKRNNLEAHKFFSGWTPENCALLGPVKDDHVVQISSGYMNRVRFREWIHLDDCELAVLLSVVHNVSVAHRAFYLSRVDSLNVVVVWQS